MLVEDRLTGALHEVPDSQLYEAPFLPPSLRAMFPWMRQIRPPFHQRPYPVGWVSPTLPYTGTAPRRLYLRCSVWPGRAGLVPAFAAQGPGVPGMPGMPGLPGPLTPQQAAAAAAGRRGRRRFRRRRR
jgi:hypothetical protein